MECKTFPLVILGVVCMTSLVGFFITKSKGFGRFATSTLLFLVVISVATIGFASGLLEGQMFASILFAVVGFAGGLLADRDKQE